MRIKNIMNKKTILATVTILILSLFMCSACKSKPPKEERKAAEMAYLDAKIAEKCATITYNSAVNALQEARRLTTEKRYDDARLHFKSAEDLFVKAMAEAKANTDCMTPKEIKPANNNEDTAEPGLIDPLQATLKNPDYTLGIVYFPFNSDEVDEAAREVLQRNSTWIINFPKAHILIEGHCDERGSLEYNLSLGERRANAVKGYLITLGVSPDVLDMISYGEEKPEIDEFTEAAFTANRRSEFKKIWK